MQNQNETLETTALTSDLRFFYENATKATKHLKFKNGVTDDELKEIIRKYPSLLSIDLSGCFQITDISFLANLNQLQSINLSGCGQITDFSFLSMCKALKRVILPSAEVLHGNDLSIWLQSPHNLQLLHAEELSTSNSHGSS